MKNRETNHTAQDVARRGTLQNSLPDIDDLDMMLIRELEKDARISFLALASRLGTSQPTVQRRYNRLVDLGIITIAAIPAYAAVGDRTVVLLAIHAPPGMLNDLTGQLSAVSNIKYLWITAGRCNIMAVAFYRSPEEYLSSFQKEFGCIPENSRIETMLPIKLIKSDLSDIAYEASAAPDSGFSITELDISVMKELEKYPRIPVKELAREIGVSLPPVRSSLRKLTSQGIIRVVATHDPAALGYNVSGTVFLQVHPSSLMALADKLKAYPCVIAMALTIGAFNCIIWTSFQTPEQMSGFLADDLGKMPGVVHYESLINLSFRKQPFNLGGRKPG